MAEINNEIGLTQFLRGDGPNHGVATGSDPGYGAEKEKSEQYAHHV